MAIICDNPYFFIQWRIDWICNSDFDMNVMRSSDFIHLQCDCVDMLIYFMTVLIHQTISIDRYQFASSISWPLQAKKNVLISFEAIKTNYVRASSQINLEFLETILPVDQFRFVSTII